jgi:hypothetical protein
VIVLFILRRLIFFIGVACFAIGGCKIHLTQQNVGSDSPAHNPDKEIYREGNSVRFPAIGVSVELGTPYLWRDWQPIVNSPGPDGGSPLYVSFDFLVTNSSESRQEIAWAVYVKGADNVLRELRFTDRSQVPLSSISIAPDRAVTIELVAHNGPYLPIGNKTSLHVELLVNNRYHAEQRTTPVIVYRTM